MQKSPDINEITGELIRVGGSIISSEIHTPIISIWNYKLLPEEWKESTIVPIYKKGYNTDCSKYGEHYLCQLLTKFYPTSFCQG